jgi:glycosyltransferase involved in cell wall biosynthesis
VDLERIHPTASDDPVRAQIRSELGIQPTDLVLLFMGWLYDFSGVREVARTLVDAPPHVRLLVVGDGDDYEALRRLRDERLGERLILTGRVPYDRIAGYLAAADVPLLPFQTVPATRHIVPIKLYEYMASGKPVIAAPLPGVQRDIGADNGVTYVPASEQVAMAHRIYLERDRLGQKARAFVEANCDWADITDRFEALLMSTIQGRNG